jgi:hypothetical protein
MTQPPRDLAAAVFRALYPGYDPRTRGGLHIVTSAGAPVFIGPSLGQIARYLGNPRPGPAVRASAPPLTVRRRGPAPG